MKTEIEYKKRIEIEQNRTEQNRIGVEQNNQSVSVTKDRNESLLSNIYLSSGYVYCIYTESQ